ncbi:MAG: acyltransferase family protein [Clostridia bacterium]|nr:acyltransferase family protein [Clostridia bacterium]
MSATLVQSSAKSEKRLGNMDLLRTICAILVVYNHFYIYISGENGFLLSMPLYTQIVYRVLFSLSVTAVPLFFVISGYFSVSSKKQCLGKVVSLFFMTFVYSNIQEIAFFVKQILVDKTFNFNFVFLVKNYYFYLFCGIYILSPYINKLLISLSKKEYKRLIIIMFLLVSVWSTIINMYASFAKIDDISSVFFTSRTGTSMGFNIVNFSMFYIIGGYFKLHYTPKSKDKTVFLFVLLISSAITSIGYFVSRPFSKVSLYYDSIFVVASAISLFVLFLNMNMRYNSAVSFAGKKTYGTFLIHSFVDACVATFISAENVFKQSPIGFIFVFLIFVLGVYILSLITTSVLQFIGKPISNIWKKTKIYNIPFI